MSANSYDEVTTVAWTSINRRVILFPLQTLKTRILAFPTTLLFQTAHAYSCLLDGTLAITYKVKVIQEGFKIGSSALQPDSAHQLHNLHIYLSHQILTWKSSNNFHKDRPILSFNSLQLFPTFHPPFSPCLRLQAHKNVRNTRQRQTPKKLGKVQHMHMRVT